jgi:hypothetical protein
MKECRECELATYCYSESSTWVFRTKEEMQEKQAAMSACPLHEEARHQEPPTPEPN